MPDDKQTQERSHSYNKDATILLASIAKSPHLDYDALCGALHKGADPNWQDNNGTPLLNLLAAKGHTPAIEAALAAGADVHGTDAKGNTAIFEAFIEAPMLALLTAGASPSHRNHEGIQACTYLPREHMGMAYRQMVVQNAQLLRDCMELETAEKSGRLSTRSWEGIWPRNSFGHPPPTSIVPVNGAAVYFLHQMKNAGLHLDKDYLQESTNGAMGMKKAIRENERAALAWRDNCDAAETPMTPQDWKNTGIFESMGKGQRIACLFTSDYWAEKKSLTDFVDFLKALPEHVYQQDSNRLHDTVSDTLIAWATHGGGKDMPSDELRAFRSDMPERVQDMFSAFHVILAARKVQQNIAVHGR